MFFLIDFIFNSLHPARLIISDPVEFHDRTFMTHIKQLPWDDQSFTQKFEIVMNTGR